MSQLLDTSALLTGYMNSKITAMLVSRLYGADATVAMPESTSRSLTSRMRLDSRVALQGAQNMQDAAAMVTAAQTDVTGIKDKLKQMKELAVEAATLDPLNSTDFAAAKDTLLGLAEDIVSIAKNSSFNGISLLDGKAGMNSDGKIQLQAGNSSREQVLTNFLDGSAAPGKTLDGSKINMENLGKQLEDLLAGVDLTDQDAAAAAFGKISGVLKDVFDRVGMVESQYSYDIKSLNNMSVLLQGQADILDSAQKNHLVGGGSEDKNSSASSSLSDLLGGGIMSAIS